MAPRVPAHPDLDHTVHAQPLWISPAPVLGSSNTRANKFTSSEGNTAPTMPPTVQRSLQQPAQSPAVNAGLASSNYFGLPPDRIKPDPAAGAGRNWSSAIPSVKSHGSVSSTPPVGGFFNSVAAPSKDQISLPNRSPSTTATATDLCVPTKKSPMLPVSLHDKMEVDSKRSSLGIQGGMLDLNPAQLPLSNNKMQTLDNGSNNNSAFGFPRQQSPAQIDGPCGHMHAEKSYSTSQRQFMLSMDSGMRLDKQLPQLGRSQVRADSLPAKLAAAPVLQPKELYAILQGSDNDSTLIIDIRVAPQYVESRIKGALNLCIPTTLLKRAAFDLKKLQSTFQDPKDQKRFATWKSAQHLVVYDGGSSDKSESQTATTTLKKFTNEGFNGKSYILRGGFKAFSAEYPQLIESGPPSKAGGNDGSSSDRTANATALPILGGVMLPAAKTSVNPFFSNIRQNMDLQGGVGRLELRIPQDVGLDLLPKWLQDAADPANAGRDVSQSFLAIEKAEQARLKEAFANFSNTQPNTGTSEGNVQICGVEKGGKNRYKDILPFEHARVVLANKPDGSCDYVNASHMKSSRSHKRYIASQGPLPTTFGDFWSVVWESDVRVIVMLTAESEGGHMKCHPYWENRKHGMFELQMTSEEHYSLDTMKPLSKPQAAQTVSTNDSSRSKPVANGFNWGISTAAADQPETQYVIIRKFILRNTGGKDSTLSADEHQVTQLHYPCWPDFGAPAKPLHLLALIEIANNVQEGFDPVQSNVAGFKTESKPVVDDSRPMLVHCSAGCGRTGAFCTVDSVLDMMRRKRRATTSKQPEQSRLAATAMPCKDFEGDVHMSTPDVISLPHRTSRGNSSKPGVRNSSDAASLSASSSKTQASANPVVDRSLNLDWLDDDKIDLVERTVEEFRQQRLSMVQTLRQFVLCYEAIIEWESQAPKDLPARVGRETTPISKEALSSEKFLATKKRGLVD